MRGLKGLVKSVNWGLDLLFLASSNEEATANLVFLEE